MDELARMLALLTLNMFARSFVAFRHRRFAITFRAQFGGALTNRIELQVHPIQAFTNGANETVAGLLYILRDSAFGPDCPAITGRREANAVIAFSGKQLPNGAIGH